jgi:hypothetical protein
MHVGVGSRFARGVGTDKPDGINVLLRHDPLSNAIEEWFEIHRQRRIRII